MRILDQWSAGNDLAASVDMRRIVFGDLDMFRDELQIMLDEADHG